MDRGTAVKREECKPRTRVRFTALGLRNERDDEPRRARMPKPDPLAPATSSTQEGPWTALREQERGEASALAKTVQS